MNAYIYVYLPPAYDDFEAFERHMDALTRRLHSRNEWPSLLCEHPFAHRYRAPRGWGLEKQEIERANYAVFFGQGDEAAEARAKERGIPVRVIRDA